MGSSLDTRQYAGNDRKAIEAKFRSEQEQSRSESGASYSGAIGVMPAGISQWHDLKLASAQAAGAWLEEHHSKWNPAEGVSFYLAAKPTEADEKARKATNEAVSVAERAVSDARKAALEELQTGGRGDYATCPSCGSRLARKRLQKTDCPLCPVERRYQKPSEPAPEGFAKLPRDTDDDEDQPEREDIYEKPAASLLTKAQLAKIERAAKVHQEARAAVKKAQEPRPSKEIGWVVGGWCSS